MAKKIFLGVFVFSCIFQTIWWKQHYLIDWGMWAHQAQYVQTSDPEQFNAKYAYGHPGGPVIIGTIIVHNFFRFTYDNSVLIFLGLFDSLIISCIAVLCYFLRKNTLWWLVASGVLVVNRMIMYVTPPSLVVSLLITFLCLLSLFFYENKDNYLKYTSIIWSFVAGLSIATRVDIGVFLTFAFVLPIVIAKGIKRGIVMLLGAFLTFCIFDPFMWFMPIKHLSDLLAKIIYHYADFSPYHLSFPTIVDISSLAFVSMFIALLFLLLRKKLILPIDPILLIVFLLATITLYIIFLTSHYQAERYFAPLVYIWETLLPLFIFSLISNINFDFIKTEKKKNIIRKSFEIFTILALIGFHFYLMFEFIWINSLYVTFR